MTMKIAVLPGDGIGPEIITQALRVLDVLKNEGMAMEFTEAPLGGQAYDQYGHPYPEFTQKNLPYSRCSIAWCSRRSTI